MFIYLYVCVCEELRQMGLPDLHRCGVFVTRVDRDSGTKDLW